MVEARPFNLSWGRTIMIIIGLVLAIVALGFLCWLLFNLAVYALPCFLGLSAGFWCYHHGSGAMAAVAAGLCAGAASLAIGRFAFAQVRIPALRMMIALAFAAPAGLAGFYAALGVSRNVGAAPHWAEGIAILGALAVGGTAFARLAVTPMAGPHYHQVGHSGMTVAGRP